MLFSASQAMPAGQRAVADERDHRARPALQPNGLGQPVGVGQRGRGVRVRHPVVLGLGPARIAGQSVALPQGREPVLPAGQDLVHVALVAGVEDHRIARGLEDPVQRDGQLDHAEVRSEVAAGLAHVLDQEAPDLLGQLAAADSGAMRTEVLRAVHRAQQSVRGGRHGREFTCSPRAVAALAATRRPGRETPASSAAASVPAAWVAASSATSDRMWPTMAETRIPTLPTTPSVVLELWCSATSSQRSLSTGDPDEPRSVSVL